MTWATLVAGVVSSGALAGFLTWWSARKKTPVEVDNLIIAGAKETVGMQGDLLVAMREDIVRLRDQMAKERATRKREMDALWDQLRIAVEHAAIVHDWIEGGMRPPPPTRPSWAVRLDPTHMPTPPVIPPGPIDNP